MGQRDSLHSRDGLPVFQLQGAGVVAGRVGGDGLLQGRGDAAEAARLVQLTVLILVLPVDLLDLVSLRVQARELQLGGRASALHCGRGRWRRSRRRRGMENGRSISGEC